MKAFVVEGINKYQLKDLPIQEPQQGEVLIKVKVAGFCRTDLKIIRHGHRDLVLPCIPGEEVVGEIIKLGAGVTGFNVGDLVFIYPGISCGMCENCNKLAENLCTKMQIMGFHRPGGFCEYVTVPFKTLIKLPDGLSPDIAVFAEPVSCILNALELARLHYGETVGIFGGGPAGTLTYKICKALGAVPTVFEPFEPRRKYTNAITLSENYSFDVIIVAVGDINAYQNALKILKPRGRLVVFSGLIPPDNLISVDFNTIHYLEQTIVGAYGFSYRHAIKAINLLSHNVIKVDDLITHRLSLNDIDLAIDIVEKKAGMKVLIYPQGE